MSTHYEEPTGEKDVGNTARESQILRETQASGTGTDDEQMSQTPKQIQTAEDSGNISLQDGDQHTPQDITNDSMSKKKLSAIEKTIMRQHVETLNAITDKCNQSLDQLDNAHKHEVSRLENAQEVLVKEAKFLKNRFLENHNFVPYFNMEHQIPKPNLQAFNDVKPPSKQSLLQGISGMMTHGCEKPALRPDGKKKHRDSVRFSIPNAPNANSTRFLVDTIVDLPPLIHLKQSDRSSDSSDNGDKEVKPAKISRHDPDTDSPDKRREKKNDNIRSPPLHVKKPAMFNGVKEDWTNWKSSFLHYAKMMKIEDDQVVEIFFYSTMGTRIQLKNLKQGTDSVSRFAEQVRELVLKSDYSPELHNDICLQAFLGGLENDADVINIREKNPPVDNLESAVRECIRRSLARKARAATRIDLTQQNLQQEVFAIKETAEQARSSQQLMFNKMKVEIAQLKDELRDARSENKPRRPQKDYFCNRCWEKNNHFSTSCTNERREEPEHLQNFHQGQDSTMNR